MWLILNWKKKRKKESKLHKFMTKMSNKNEFIFLCLLLNFNDHKIIPKIGGMEYSFMYFCFVYFCDVVGIIYCARFAFRRCFGQQKPWCKQKYYIRSIPNLITFNAIKFINLNHVHHSDVLTFILVDHIISFFNLFFSIAGWYVISFIWVNPIFKGIKISSNPQIIYVFHYKKNNTFSQDSSFILCTLQIG